jgi:uncharacterized protein YbbC (DUF1343 family)
MGLIASSRPIIFTPADAPAIHQTGKYLPLLQNKNVGIVGNLTSCTKDGVHLLDLLLQNHIRVKAIFSPEHGFRGQAGAGEKIADDTDSQTGLPIISLYGKNRKPHPEQFAGLEVIIFDLQDVGVRFYTYLSTLHNVMEAAAEQNIEVIVLDRPNPNGHYVDGPTLKLENRSFVGMHPIPVVHGMTLGELALMINGESWLANGIRCKLTVIPCQHYTHSQAYTIPIVPSPNLPNQRAIYLYPGLCFFEGTNVSVGRGTSTPFQIYGSPDLDMKEYCFTPEPNAGSKEPPLKGLKCYGRNLSTRSVDSLFLKKMLDLDDLIFAYQNTRDKSKFFNKFFIKLAGTDLLQKQIEEGLSSSTIRASWQNELNLFRQKRALYLLYPN